MPQRHRLEALMRALACAALVLLACRAFGADRAIQDIRFAKQGGIASAEIQFVCPMEYLTHWADGLEVRVRMELGADCATQLGAGMRSELYTPPSGSLAGVRQVVFDAQDRIATLILQLDRAADLRVSQGRLRNVVRIEFSPPTSDSAQTLPTAAPPPPRNAIGAPPPAGAISAAPPPTEPAARAPLRLVQRPPERSERFAIQLATGAGVAENATALPAGAGGILYVKERVAGDRQWQELRLGFFDTEQAARARADALRTGFPDAVVVVADTSEQDAASAGPLQPSAAADSGSHDVPALSPERVAALIAEASDAMASQSYDRAIQIYSRLLDEPDFADRRLARERLGVARERKGQRAQAIHEYQAYVAEFSDGPDSDRVRQRLAALTATSLPGEATVSAATPPRYELSGGVAQYLRHDVYTPLDDQPERDVQSTLLSNVDLALKRHGERFQLQSRIDATYGYNLRDETEGNVAPAEQLYVSNAYVDVADRQRGWSGRLGRQTIYGSGIFGRFDGMHADYHWRPRVALNLEVGRPVEYLRRAIDTHRQFAAFSADVDGLVRGWDFSFYSLAQQIDGIADRQAVGAEARHRGDAWNVIGSVDVDPSYGVLNSAIVSANWRPRPKLTLNGRFNIGTAPFLTTRNALIGQQVATIEALLGTYTEGQVRTLARDRTAQVQSSTIGLVKPLFSRFQLNVDLSVYDFGATVASGGVAAMPQNKQTSLYMAFVGSSLAKQGDAAVFSLRHTDSTTATGDTVSVEFRLPATSRLRLSPRFALSHRAYKDGSDQTVVAPMFRAAYRWPRGHQLELEVGKELANRDFLPAQLALFGQTTEQSEATFFNAGYWWGF
ncbi:MAG: tetratricopeptide repeat protein [Gammaproteobacteria bacterium]